MLYSNKDESDKAIEAMDGVTPEGFTKPLAVRYAAKSQVIAVANSSRSNVLLWFNY